jgi:hypothetical protein
VCPRAGLRDGQVCPCAGLRDSQVCPCAGLRDGQVCPRADNRRTERRCGLKTPPPHCHILPLFTAAAATASVLLFFGVEPSPLSLLLRPPIGLLYQPWMVDRHDCGAVSGMNGWQGKLKYWEETCPSAAVSTTNPISLDPGRRGLTAVLGSLTEVYLQ